MNTGYLPSAVRVYETNKRQKSKMIRVALADDRWPLADFYRNLALRSANGQRSSAIVYNPPPTRKKSPQ